MTEKYKGIYVGDCLIIHDENGELKVDEVLDRLNELNNKNITLIKQNNDYFKNINNLILDNIIFKNESIAVKKRIKLIEDYLSNHNCITLKKYNDIIYTLYLQQRNDNYE